MSTQLEQALEDDLVQQLAEQCYGRVTMPGSEALLANSTTHQLGKAKEFREVLMQRMFV